MYYQICIIAIQTVSRAVEKAETKRRLGDFFGRTVAHCRRGRRRTSKISKIRNTRFHCYSNFAIFVLFLCSSSTSFTSLFIKSVVVCCWVGLVWVQEGLGFGMLEWASLSWAFGVACWLLHVACWLLRVRVGCCVLGVWLGWIWLLYVVRSLVGT